MNYTVDKKKVWVIDSRVFAIEAQHELGQLQISTLAC